MKQTSRCALTLVLLFACFVSLPFHADAKQSSGTGSASHMQIVLKPRATSSFHIYLTAYGISEAEESFPLEAGETVGISAVYTPSDAIIDIGLVDDSGQFHYFTSEDGKIDSTISIEEIGTYTLAVRNRSEYFVQITGFVTY